MKNPILSCNPTRFTPTLLLSKPPFPTKHLHIPSRVGFTPRTNPFRCLSLLHHYHPHETFPVISPSKPSPTRHKLTRLQGSTQTTSNNTESSGAEDDNNKNKEEKKTNKREVKLKLAFMKKVYGVLVTEFLLVAGAYTFAKIFPQTAPMVTENFYLFFFIMLTGAAFLIPIEKLDTSIILGLFNVAMIVPLGLNLTDLNGKILLAGVISTVVTVSLLIKFAFWASKKGKNYSFLKPLLFFSLIVVLIASSSQMPIPVAVNTLVGTLTFSGYIVYDTRKLLKQCDDDELVEASLDLHVDISGLFFRILKIIQMFSKLS